jgi:hypothetical protein
MFTPSYRVPPPPPPLLLQGLPRGRAQRSPAGKHNGRTQLTRSLARPTDTNTPRTTVLCSREGALGATAQPDRRDQAPCGVWSPLSSRAHPPKGRRLSSARVGGCSPQYLSLRCRRDAGCAQGAQMKAAREEERLAMIVQGQQDGGVTRCADVQRYCQTAVLMMRRARHLPCTAPQ